MYHFMRKKRNQIKEVRQLRSLGSRGFAVWTGGVRLGGSK